MKEVSELLTALGTFLVGLASLIKVCKALSSASSPYRRKTPKLTELPLSAAFSIEKQMEIPFSFKA